MHYSFAPTCPLQKQSREEMEILTTNEIADGQENSVSEYLSNNNVQLGASYPVAQRSTQLFAAGSEAVAKYVNCDPSEIGKAHPLCAMSPLHLTRRCSHWPLNDPTLPQPLNRPLRPRNPWF